MFAREGMSIAKQVCDNLGLFESGSDADRPHLAKRESMCTGAFQRLWGSCKHLAQHQAGMYTASRDLVECVKANGTIEELIEIKKDMTGYGRCFLMNGPL